MDHEDLHRTLVSIARAVIYAFAFVAIVSLLVLAVAIKDATGAEAEGEINWDEYTVVGHPPLSDETKQALAKGIVEDFTFINSVCVSAFDMDDEKLVDLKLAERAVLYYACMGKGYGISAKNALDKTKEVEEAKKSSKEVRM